MSTYDAGLPATGRSQPGDARLRAHIAWGGGGFLLGVIVWHFIGFWSFISTVVFHGPDPATATAAPPAPAARPSRAASKRSETVLGAAPAQAQAISGTAPSDCSALVLDRATGTTTLTRCADGLKPMQIVQSSQRGNRHIAAEVRHADWNVVVDAQSDTLLAEPQIDMRLDPRLGQRAVQLD